MNDISYWVAFAAGVLSLFSPCVVVMIPVFLGSLCGPDIFENRSGVNRFNVFLHSLSFVLGFSVVFVTLGTLAGLIGFSLSTHSNIIRLISGGLIIVFGLFLLAASRITWLNYEKRITLKHNAAGSYLGSFVIGLIFSLAWTPCVGPVLGGILTLTLNSKSVWQGTYLLIFYSIGMGLPFLVIGLFLNTMMPLLRKINHYSRYVYLISGVLLIGTGLLILLDKLSWFSF